MKIYMNPDRLEESAIEQAVIDDATIIIPEKVNKKIFKIKVALMGFEDVIDDSRIAYITEPNLKPPFVFAYADEILDELMGCDENDEYINSMFI